MWAAFVSIFFFPRLSTRNLNYLPTRTAFIPFHQLFLAVIFHLTGSTLVGLLYGAMLPMIARRPVLLGGSRPDSGRASLLHAESSEPFARAVSVGAGSLLRKWHLGYRGVVVLRQTRYITRKRRSRCARNQTWGMMSLGMAERSISENCRRFVLARLGTSLLCGCGSLPGKPAGFKYLRPIGSWTLPFFTGKTVLVATVPTGKEAQPRSWTPFIDHRG